MDELDLSLDMPDIGGIELDLDLGDFDLSASADVELETRIIKPKYHHPINQRMVKAERASGLASQINLERGMRVHCVVSGNFIFSQFLAALLIDSSIRAKRIVISTLSMSQDCIESLKDICDIGLCERLDLIVSAYFYSHERRKLIPYLYESLDYDDAPFQFQLAVAGTHCKTILIETEGGAKLVIHGSANLRSSRSLEQFSIEENQDLYDFHVDYSDKIIAEYKTINKEVRAGKLWRSINERIQPNASGEIRRKYSSDKQGKEVRGQI